MRQAGRIAQAIVLALVLVVPLSTASGAGYVATWTKANSGPWLIWEATGFAPTTGQLIVFGGQSWFGGLKADTWLFNPSRNAWNMVPTQRKGSPQARAHARLAWDPGNSRMLMFGGRTGGGAVLQDTWAFDPATNKWTGLITSCRRTICPPARWGHAMVWSSVLGGLVVFGGNGGMNAAMDDTWFFDGSTWSRISTPVHPSARFLAGMAEDPLTGNILLYGGVSAAMTTLPETWMFDPRTRSWTPVPTATTPEPSAEVGMAWLAAAQAIVVTTGSIPGDCQTGTNSVWAFDTAARNWVRLATTGGPPTPRTNSYLVTDTVRGSAILIGPPDPNVPPEQSDYVWILR